MPVTRKTPCYIARQDQCAVKAPFSRGTGVEPLAQDIAIVPCDVGGEAGGVTSRPPPVRAGLRAARRASRENQTRSLEHVLADPP